MRTVADSGVPGSAKANITRPCTDGWPAMYIATTRCHLMLRSSGIGSDVQRPLATVIIGGLTSTLIFAPVIIPPLYLWLAKRK
ncbi:hypothetical protein [Dyadobacter endophyticus]|uniref:hypothetical protein n=1 Tax=Dyadobacter endophyticus TaxID=1749036 RepID=UPI00166C659C|nr:hypothetical protein [Dyadobacter endophyticus]